MRFPKTLVAEDDPNAALLLHCAFKSAGIDSAIHFVSDGVEAIDYLRGKQLFERVASSTLPGLFLLDLDMPRLNGFGVLEWLRRHPHLRPLRVVVFSSSKKSEELDRATSLGADLCLSKTSNAGELAHVIRLLQDSFYGRECRERPSQQNELALQPYGRETDHAEVRSSSGAAGLELAGAAAFSRAGVQAQVSSKTRTASLTFDVVPEEAAYGVGLNQRPRQ